MTDRVRHPRALKVFRFGLYLFTAIAVLALAVATVLYLGAVVLVGGLAVLLTGSGESLPVIVLVVLGILTSGTLVGLFGVGSRRLDRYVRRIDAVPDPVETLADLYVADAIDEYELERRLDALLGEAVTVERTFGDETEANDHAAAVERAGKYGNRVRRR